MFNLILDFVCYKDILEIQEGAIKAGQNVLVVDDLLATGGTKIFIPPLVYCLMQISL